MCASSSTTRKRAVVPFDIIRPFEGMESIRIRAIAADKIGVVDGRSDHLGRPMPPLAGARAVGPRKELLTIAVPPPSAQIGQRCFAALVKCLSTHSKQVIPVCIPWHAALEACNGQAVRDGHITRSFATYRIAPSAQIGRERQSSSTREEMNTWTTRVPAVSNEVSIAGLQLLLEQVAPESIDAKISITLCEQQPVIITSMPVPLRRMMDGSPYGKPFRILVMVAAAEVSHVHCINAGSRRQSLSHIEDGCLPSINADDELIAFLEPSLCHRM